MSHRSYNSGGTADTFSEVSEDQKTDSGIGFEEYRRRCRDRLLSSLDSSKNTGIVVALPTAGRGRGQLLRSLQENETALNGAKPMRGRGRAELLKSLIHDSASSLSSGHSSGRNSKDSDSSSNNNATEMMHTEAAGRSVQRNGRFMEEHQQNGAQYKPHQTRGQIGKTVNLASNYIRINVDANKGVFQYEVRFRPTVDSTQLRIKYLNQHREHFGGTKTFDGSILYLPIKLPQRETVFVSECVSEDGTNVEITVIYKKEEQMRNCMHLYNVLFDRVMKSLNYVRFQRKQFDPTEPIIIPQARLEIWPGYVTAVDEFEGGVMLCCDVSHKLLCQTSVLEVLTNIHISNPGNMQDIAKKALLGSVVITRYNNRTYRVDDIAFEKSPTMTLQTQNGEITFLQYYRKNYNIQINDNNQPLLVSIQKRRGGNEDEENFLLLIPELCYLTGLRDEQRSDYRLMRELATFTRCSPNQRIAALEKFYKNVNSCPEAVQILENWGLTLNNSSEHLLGRYLPPETIHFAHTSFSTGENGDFNKYVTSNKVMSVVHFQKWILMFCRMDTRRAQTFYDMLMRNTPPLGISVNKPDMVSLENDRTDTFINAIRRNVHSDTQIVVLISPTLREDRYAAIKKVCCSELPVATQVILSKTLCDERTLRSVVQKVALQMNCKLGGTLWSVDIPMDNIMICGIDSYHEAGQRANSVAAFVASTNTKHTKWFSKAVIQTRKEEIVVGLTAAFIAAVSAYFNEQGRYPSSIIIYRDGVGDGQLMMCSEFEIPQFSKAVNHTFPNYNPNITFVVVQKRTNTRFFQTQRNSFTNPLPGTIVDAHITRKQFYDFFLVPQAVKQGTVTPTHYVILRDDSNYTPDMIQRLTYKLCFLYYNWPGSIRNPACCQYAHKLAYLVGKCVRRTPSDKLSNVLFYL